jgi:hypothetical protein
VIRLTDYPAGTEDESDLQGIAAIGAASHIGDRVVGGAGAMIVG